MPPKAKRGDDDNDFDTAESGAANCFMVKASSIKKGDPLLIKGYPCKCVSTSTSKTGKHGGAKCHIVGLDIFTGKKHENIFGSTVDVDCPTIVKRDLLVSVYDKKDGQVTALNENNEEENFKVNEEMMKQMAELDFDSTSYQITVMEALGQQELIAIKEDKQ